MTKCYVTENERGKLEGNEIPSEMILDSCEVKRFVAGIILDGFTLQQREAHAEFTKNAAHHFIDGHTIVSFIPQKQQ